MIEKSSIQEQKLKMYISQKNYQKQLYIDSNMLVLKKRLI